MYGLIYCATNTVNGKQYVGQTTLTLARRWQGHLKSALRYFSMGALHCAIRKYGVEAFAIEQIDVAGSQDELNEREIHHIARLGTCGGGYNLTPGGGQPDISEETRKKMSEAQKGHVTSVGARQKISKALTGCTRSRETRQKMSNGQKGHVVSEETRHKSFKSHARQIAEAEDRRKDFGGGVNHRNTSCPQGHVFDEVNARVDYLGGRHCLTCYYLCNGRKLPEKLKQYVTGKEVYNKKEKTAQ